MGDAADYLTDAGLAAKAAHDHGACEPSCPWCADEAKPLRWVRVGFGWRSRCGRFTITRALGQDYRYVLADRHTDQEYTYRTERGAKGQAQLSKNA